MVKNPLLNDEFLKELDRYRNRITYARLTSLTLDSYPIEQIEGVVTNGTVTIDGDSSLRRICQLSMTTKNVNLNNVYWGVSTRVKIEIGLERKFDTSLNDIQGYASEANLTDLINKALKENNLIDLLNLDLTDKYKEYPEIIWFPLGVYILTDFSTSQQVNDYVIELSGKDKMCLLNGDIGGIFNAETDLGKEEIEQEDGSYKKVYRSIPYIIREMIHYYAQEPFNNIIIKNINELALEVLKNNSDNQIFLIYNPETEQIIQAIDPSIKENNKEENDEKNYIEKMINALYNIALKFGDEGKAAFDLIESGIVENEQEGFEQLKQLISEYDNDDDIEEYSIDEIQEAFKNEENSENDEDLDYVYTEHTNDKVDFTHLDNNFIFANTLDEDDTSLIDNSYISPLATKIKKVIKRNKRGRIIESIDCVIINIEPGEDLGYQIRELTYPEDLIAGAGETVTQVLDKIVNQFGNYEYFYNLDGQFVFQEKQTYINTHWNNIITTSDKETYIEPAAVAKKVTYSFEGSILTTAYSNTPNIGDVKNDYTVWGKKQTDSGAEIPIHMRYAIDLKPYFYRAFDKTIYIVENYFSEVEKDILFGNEYRDHPLPPYLVDRFSWWHIEDWYNYYKAVTEVEPLDQMMAYQAPTNAGFKDRIYFPEGEKNFYSTTFDDNHRLIIAFEDKPKEPEKYVVYLSNYPCFIFDVQTTGPYTGFPVGWIGWKDSSCTVPAANIGGAFQHRLNGCGHPYDWFLRKAQEKNYASYVYQPKIIDTIVNEEKLVNDVIICDWREIIYQMAKDYYLYNHDNDFYYNLRLNNYLPNAGEHGIILYQNGRTGYEQYYHDLQGFWRQLYLPNSAIENRKRIDYFDSFRKIIAVPENDYLSSVTFSMQRQENGDYILINESNGVEYELTLKQLIAKDQAIEVKENTLSTSEQELNTLQKQAREEYIANGVANENLSNQIDMLKDIIVELKEEINTDIKNMMPGFISFEYQCPNEEDFFDNIEYTTRGLPIFDNRTVLDNDKYGHWNKYIFTNPSKLLFWFDFFDADSLGIGQFSIPAIGDRPKVINNDAVKAIIYKDIPDVIFIKGSDYNKYKEDLSVFEGYDIIKITNDDDTESSFIYDYMEEEIPKIVKSGRGLTAQEQIDDLLYNFSYCNETITITSVPIYYLEPNTIISAKDEQRVVNGYYILNKMTIPLQYNETMQINAIKVPERIY